MNIWYLTSEYPPDFGGGISMYIENVASMFADKGHKVTVLVRDPHINKIEYPKDNLRVIRFKHMSIDQYQHLGYWAALSYEYNDEVLSLIDKDNESPDIIEVQDYNAIGYYLLQNKYLNEERLMNTKIIVHLHTPTFELARINQLPRYKFPTYWIGQMEKFCINAADSIITQSEFLKKQIQPYAPDKIITVIPLPYDINGKSNKWNPCEEYENGILYMGRLEYRKGVVNLLKSADNLWNKGYKFTLSMLGGDTFFSPKQRNLGDILKEKYSNRINEGLLKFKASVEPSKLNDEIFKAKAVVIPSLYENYPYNCLIPMSLECPMIVSESGGQAEMVEKSGENGYIFDWEIEGDFEKKLIELLSLDNNELKRIGINGFNNVKKLCNKEDNYSKREGFYQKVIEQAEAKSSNQYPVSLSIPEKKLGNIDFKGEKRLLSIVIPFYNLGEHLQETLNSALSIDYQNFEIIIINDGTTDEKSIEVLRDIENTKNSQIRIVNIKNGGLANARNIGAKEAKGEFIAFLDADDLILPNFYGKSIDILNSYNNISFVYSWVRFFGAETGIWPTFSTEFPYFLGMNMLTAFVVVRRGDFLSFGCNRKEMEYGMEDFESWLNMCENGCSGVSIPQALVQYRVRHQSMSRQFNRDMVIYLLDKLSSNHPKLYKEFGLEINNLLVANGPGYLWNNPTFDHPEVGYITNSTEIDIDNNKTVKYELMRIANSKWGSKIIKFLFKFKINRIFK